MSDIYAIIRDGGRELKVKEGERILVDLRSADSGDEITFPDVLLVSSPDGVTVGKPVVDGASVVGPRRAADLPDSHHSPGHHRDPSHRARQSSAGN